ncbi:MAG: tetratricopeptide repeat protein [bacterium]
MYVLARAARFEEAQAAIDSSKSHVIKEPFYQNPFYWAAKGWLALQVDDSASACSCLERAYSEESSFIHGYALGLAYLNAGRPEDAVTIFEKLVKGYKEDRVSYPLEAVKLYYHLGTAYQNLGRRKEATSSYEEFLEIWKDADPAFDEIKSDARRRLAAETAEAAAGLEPLPEVPEEKAPEKPIDPEA